MTVIVVLAIWVIFSLLYITETKTFKKFVLFSGFFWILTVISRDVHDAPTTLITWIIAIQVLVMLLSSWRDTFSTDDKNGTVTIHETNLMWQRFAIGQTWNGDTTEGAATALTYEDAKNISSNLAGKSDWRLPTFDELSSILKEVNSVKFPNAPLEFFWSSSISDDTKTRGIHFGSGAEFRTRSKITSRIRYF